MVRHSMDINGIAAVALLCCLRGSTAQYDTCTTGMVADIGNGQCDATNNNPSCGYDGGDCCPCTCVDSPTHSCANSDFDCIFPDCGDPGTTPEDATCNEDEQSNGMCDPDNNNPSCGYDGGDCCACSCVDSPDIACGMSRFDCLDPTCFDADLVSEFPDCTGNWMMIGDGTCNDENNNLACGYDGGDCCICSCTTALCSYSVFDCLDTSAYGEFYECKAPPPVPLPCSTESQQTWVVDDSAQVQALTAAVNCSGGLFEVEWRGSIVVDRPIYVVDGTVLTVTGVGSNAAMDGNASTRLFTVVNATLHVSGVDVQYGASTAGGAIAVAGSTLTLDRTNFIGNSATSNGGAVFVSDGSSVSCFGGGTFAGNKAAADGGAMYVTGSSVVSCDGSWLYNTAGDTGGAFMVVGDSSVSWSDAAFFAYNTAGRHGGAVYALDGSSVSWTAPTTFFFNGAGTFGGALAILFDSSVSWTGETTFDSNWAAMVGGALQIWYNSSASWSGVTTYVNNSAQSRGGALCAGVSSAASWSANTTFLGNIAGQDGGAIYLEDSNVSWKGEISSRFETNEAWALGGGVMLLDSRASCTGKTTNIFSRNSGISGGALYVAPGSSVSFAGNTSFDGNAALGDSENETMAGNGGAVTALNSAATWDGQVVFTGNTAANNGGAFHVENSIVLWSGEMMMALNNASMGGGAISAIFFSNVSWIGETVILNNSAGAFGGALFIVDSTSFWRGNTILAHNFAGPEGSDMTSTEPVGEGGALAALYSSVFWSGGTTLFIDNFAGFLGGALYVLDSEISWRGDTEFVRNRCVFGGSALCVERGASVSWSGGKTIFSRNYAGHGTLWAGDSNVSWSGATEFVNNSAVISGGAVFVRNGSYVHWTGDTNFTSNEAKFGDGGSVASPALDSVLNQLDSALVISGITTFFNNTAGGNGGALALLGACTLDIDTVDVSFDGNSAGVAGGAVFVSSAGVGLVFSNAKFISNRAQVGGAVSVFGSGNWKETYDAKPKTPTKFDRCRFIENWATTTGGAIESAAGHDVIASSVFEGNAAGTGGALRLAGTANVYNCSFVENTSDDGEGAAVSNIGVLEKMEDNSFSGNGFNCPSGMFLGYSAAGNPFEIICHGCDSTCDGCLFVEGLLAPTCTEAVHHSTSRGGNVTLEGIEIERGYWRATASSTEILACYHADACLGGVTGTPGYCLEGYKGPYCSICSDGYAEQLSFTCRKCSETSAGGIVLAVFLAIAALFMAVAIVSYLVSGEDGLGAGHGAIEHLTRYIPLQSVKIVIVAWQILTQFVSVANVTYPDVYQDFLNGLDVLNFDLSWVISAGCVFDINFHDKLLVSTISPILALLFLACTYAAAIRINSGAPEKLQNVWHKHVSMVLLLTFFVYSSVSSTLFQAFACEELDDGNNYLRSDYRIECDSSTHRGFQVYASFMIVMYTVGIPALYSGLLYRDREVLKKGKADRKDPPRVTSISGLWTPYKPSTFYYEVIECGRRILLAGVVVFIYPNTAAQIAVTLMTAFAFVLISEGLAPYISKWDTWISRMGHVVVYVSMFVALLLKVDVSDERASSQKVFEAVLVAVHVCMVLVVMIETIVLACSLRAEQKEELSPHFRGDKSLGGKIAEEKEQDA